MDLNILKQKNSWWHAFRGIFIFIRHTKNFRRVHLPVYVIIVLAGIFFGVSSLEWVCLVFSIGLMLVAESLNSAIEVHMGLTSPEYHPHARDTKDISAGAVLLSGFTALTVFAIIFLPKILSMLE